MPIRSFTCALILWLGLVPQSMAFAQDTLEETGQDTASENEINAFYQEVIAELAGQSSPVFPIDAEALIAFTVAEDGSLESSEVAQSSGSAPLDQAALTLVQNAAPFPIPPAGANRSLSITIKSTRPALGFGNLDRLRP